MSLFITLEAVGEAVCGCRVGSALGGPVLL